MEASNTQSSENTFTTTLLYGDLFMMPSILTRMGNSEAVGGLEIIYVVIQMERLLGHVLVGVVELNGKSESAVLLHRGPHEEPPLEKKGMNTNISKCVLSVSSLQV